MPAIGSSARTQSSRLVLGARGDVVAFLGDAQSEDAVLQALSDGSGNAANTVRRGDIAKAIEFLKTERSPYVLIVDITGVALPVSEVQRLAEVCEPGVHVIVVGDRNEIGLYRDLTRAGVADYIVKPVTRELIVKTIQAVSDGAATGAISQKLGKLVAVTGTRGGIGTTTMAVNLAWYLANRQGRRVALVDLDLQTGDCGLMLDIKSSPGLREALDNPYRIDPLFLERVMGVQGNHLFVLTGEESLRDELRFSADAAETLLSALQSQFHYVVLDVPRTPSAVNQRAIDLATLRVIVADETIRSVREIVRLRSVLGGRRPGHSDLLVINRRGEARPGSVPHKEFLDAVELQPIATIPVITKRRAKSASYGNVAAAGSGHITDAVAALATEISGQHTRRKRWMKWR